MDWFKYKTGIGLLCLSSFFSAQAFELPFLAEEARAQGYTLPKPYGISIGAMHVDQGIQVDSIGFSGLAINSCLIPPCTNPSIPIPSDLVEISANNGRQKSDVYSIRADVWVLPFLNLYAIGGKMTGYSETDVTISKIGNYEPLNPESFNFRLDLDGNLYGGGLVVAGGMGNWFTLIDASLTKTRLTVIDGEIEAFVFSPRVGYDFNDRGIPLRVWAGGMYQEVEQSLSGYIHNLSFGNELDDFIKIFNVDETGRFHVEQRLNAAWNTLLGFQYQFTPEISLLGEGGMGRRKSAMLSLEYRF